MLPDSPDNIIFYEILNLNTEIDYETNEKLIYKIIGQAIDHLKKGLNENDFNKLILRYKNDVARIIYDQMIYYSKIVAPKYEVKLMKTSSEILPHEYSKYKKDEIANSFANMAGYEVKSKVFDYFSKACHTEYKFDSVPEQIFSVVLERDPKVLKWLRPTQKQFKIIWKEGKHYTPDFVVETDEKIYIIEIKSYKDIHDEDVKLKAKAAKKYCQCVNIYAKEYKTEPFEYLLIPAEEIKRSSTFGALVSKNHENKIAVNLN